MDMSNFPQKSDGPILLGVEIPLMIISTIIIFTRIYIRARVSKAIGLDDYLALAAYILVMVSASLDLYSISNGAGRSINQLNTDQINIFLTVQPISTLMYFIFIGLIRLSILAFLPRLNKQRWYMACIWVLALVTLSAMLAPFFYVLTACNPILDLFHPSKIDRNCRPQMDEDDAMYAHAATGIMTDIALFLLPIWVICANAKFNKKMFQITLMFGIGLFAIVAGIIRFVVLLNTDFAVNQTHKIVYLSLWTILEVHVGLWCSSFPALQLLLRTIANKTRGSDNKLSNNDTESAPHHSKRSGNLCSRQNSAAQSTNSDETGILGGGSESSMCNSATETVELDSVHDYRGSRLFKDMRVSVEGGKRCYVSKRTEFREPWNPL